MRTVRTERHIVEIEVISLTYGSGFLPHGKVRGSRIRMLEALVFSLDFDGVYHTFKLAKHCHIVEYSHEIGVGKVFLFVCYALVVLIYRDVFEMDFSGFTKLYRINE